MTLFTFSTNIEFVYANSAYIIDNADILSDSEEAKLLENINSIKTNHNIDVFIITENEIYTTRQKYIESFYKNEKLNDAMIMLINMDSNDRGVEIRGFDIGADVLDGRVESSLDDIVPYLTKGEYYSGCNKFVSLCENYIEKGPKEGINSFIVINVISLAMAGFVVWSLLDKSTGKNKTSHSTYADYQSSKILGQQDKYTHTTRSVVKKPSQGSGGRGGRSVGGGRGF